MLCIRKSHKRSLELNANFLEEKLYFFVRHFVALRYDSVFGKRVRGRQNKIP